MLRVFARVARGVATVAMPKKSSPDGNPRLLSQTREIRSNGDDNPGKRDSRARQNYRRVESPACFIRATRKHRFTYVIHRDSSASFVGTFGCFVSASMREMRDSPNNLQISHGEEVCVRRPQLIGRRAGAKRARTRGGDRSRCAITTPPDFEGK